MGSTKAQYCGLLLLPGAGEFGLTILDLRLTDLKSKIVNPKSKMDELW
jgi:hypothetical protein